MCVFVCVVYYRLDQYTGRNGQPTSHANDSLALASQDALRYIQLSNGYQMLTGAQAAATEAWLQVRGTFLIVSMGYCRALWGTLDAFLRRLSFILVLLV